VEHNSGFGKERIDLTAIIRSILNPLLSCLTPRRLVQFPKNWTSLVKHNSEFRKQRIDPAAIIRSFLNSL
jgi:hypothetical protein